MGVNDLSNEEFSRLYGRWARRTPDEAANLFADYPRTWWIAGGWAIEAYTGISRLHEDLDLSVLRSDLPLLREHLAGRLDVWAAGDGALRPLLPDDNPTAPADEVLPAGSEQVWTRRSALDPWEYDVLLAPGDEEVWVYKRDPSIRLPMADALWQRDGVRYLRPEIQLLYKARGLRAKDQKDFTSTLPQLDDVRRDWLRTALSRTLPDHPWIPLLAS